MGPQECRLPTAEVTAECRDDIDGQNKVPSRIGWPGMYQSVSDKRSGVFKCIEIIRFIGLQKMVAGAKFGLLDY